MNVSHNKLIAFNFIYLVSSLYIRPLYIKKPNISLLHGFNMPSKKKYPKKIEMQSGGFTLIEVLITLMIMGILVSTLMPNFAKIQSKAKEVSVKNIGHQLQLAIEGYYLSEGIYPSLENAGIEELGNELIKTGELKEFPKNPFTNMPYKNQDTSGQIRYITEQNGYRLVMMGMQNQENILVLRN